MAGDGILAEALRENAKEMGLAGIVEFTGELDQPDLAGLLRSADIYVSSSRSDSTSVSLLEAMACGAFPVVTSIPGNLEWITDGRNGLTFPPGDPAALATCLQKALADNELRSNAADRAGVKGTPK